MQIKKLKQWGEHVREIQKDDLFLKMEKKGKRRQKRAQKEKDGEIGQKRKGVENKLHCSL